MSITCKELAKKLRDYAAQSPENAATEIMLMFDGNLAFPFAAANSTTAMDMGTNVKRFLVFMPDFKGDKLELKQLIGH